MIESFSQSLSGVVVVSVVVEWRQLLLKSLMMLKTLSDAATLHRVRGRTQRDTAVSQWSASWRAVDDNETKSPNTPTPTAICTVGLPTAATTTSTTTTSTTYAPTGTGQTAPPTTIDSSVLTMNSSCRSTAGGWRCTAIRSTSSASYASCTGCRPRP